MKLKTAKLAKKSESTIRAGRIITISMKGIPVVTPEMRRRMEVAARKQNAKGNYPVLIEA
ncbi:hypothetical protein EVC37_25820 [Methylocaldum sp. BRCS4]|jgi:hypothetical protein|uniref:hypothetical protein n=1 Tax=Methylocaldum sp. GT1BB TaxID=3438963 RepID=UPI000A321192|nr:hypothetical protein [Methylocaldum sp. BRCS4]